MELFEITLLKNWSFLNVCLGISFVFASDFTFASLLPLMMTHDGFSKSDAALAVTVGATAELVSRCLLALFTLVVDIKAKYLFFMAMICMAFAKVGKSMEIIGRSFDGIMYCLILNDKVICITKTLWSACLCS